MAHLALGLEPDREQSPEFAGGPRQIDRLPDSLRLLEALPGDDPKQRQPDINLAKDKLGWEPGIELEAGLKPTINYFSELLGVSP